MKRVVLVTGGARSGKSRYALDLARRRDGKKVFIATAEPTDEEMRERIRRHRDSRGDAFETVEEPLDPGGAIRSLAADVEVALVDCLTVWLGNLMHRTAGTRRDGGLPQVASFLEAVRDPPCDLVIVTNEVGMGIVPHNDMARGFRDIAGGVNQEVAALADRVVLMVSGVPVVVKDGKRQRGPA